MDNQKIMIGVLCAIVVILVILTILSLPLLRDKSTLIIKDREIDEGESVAVILIDKDKAGISDKTINIKLFNEKGIVNEKKVTTNGEGKAKLKIDETGKYTIEASFDGGGEYAPSFISDFVKVKKAKTKVVSEDKTSNYDSVSGLSDDGYSYYPSSGPEVDSQGVTREYASAHNMRYIPQTIDGVDCGMYVPPDQNGVYHT